jgi:hypothetical protein
LTHRLASPNKSIADITITGDVTITITLSTTITAATTIITTIAGIGIIIIDGRLAGMQPTGHAGRLIPHQQPQCA